MPSHFESGTLCNLSERTETFCGFAINPGKVAVGVVDLTIRTMWHTGLIVFHFGISSHDTRCSPRIYNESKAFLPFDVVITFKDLARIDFQGE